MDSTPQNPQINRNKNQRFTIILAIVCFILLAFDFAVSDTGKNILSYIEITYQNAKASNEFSDSFDNIKLNETGKMSNSESPDWWLSSGGYFNSKNGVARTPQRFISKSNYWYKKYKKSNPKDTDKGSHPQNIFRLVTRSKWENFTQQVYFQIRRNNLSKSKNRNSSNGILLFNHYQDQDNLYYAGVRVDGRAVIKKKIDGDYYTLTQKRVFKGDYDRKDRPNLIPKRAWMGLKSEVTTNSDDTVTINLYLDEKQNGDWRLVLSATDDNESYGGEAIRDAGYGGIRTDFMDVEFDNYKIQETD